MKFNENLFKQMLHNAKTEISSLLLKSLIYFIIVNTRMSFSVYFNGKRNVEKIQKNFDYNSTLSTKTIFMKISLMILLTISNIF